MFGETESIPIVESLINAYFLAAGLSPVQVSGFLPRELGPETAGLKLTVLDVVALATDGRTVNIEIQTTEEQSFVDRSLFYWSRLYSRQLTSGLDYRQLKILMVDLVQLAGMVERRNDLKTAVIWSKFPEEPLRQTFPDPGPLAATFQIARTRMEKFMALTPQVLREIYDEKVERDTIFIQNLAAERGSAEGHERGLQDGVREGREQGIEQGIEQVARRMLADRVEPDQVARFTVLAVDRVRALLP